jgi:carboxyl-terminal processing protease
LGTETFGKGLVQKVYNIDNSLNTKLKITTAKYYIPSGRCIQKFDYTKDNGIFSHAEDSLLVMQEESHDEFYTINKRVVYEKGGISPDINIEDDDLSNLVFELYRQSIFFNFAVKYNQEHPKWDDNFGISDSILDTFYEYLKEIDFQYKVEGEENLEKFITTAEKNKTNPELLETAKNLLQKLQSFKNEDVQNHREEIRKALLPEIADKYFDHHTRIKYTLKNDLQLKSALQVLNNQIEYKKILAIN